MGRHRAGGVCVEPAGARLVAARKRQVAHVVADVAARLGNTPAVCRGSYIHPRVVDAYVDDTVACGTTRLREARMSADEASVLAFLRRLSRSSSPGTARGSTTRRA